jgi:hypothetical protein
MGGAIESVWPAAISQASSRSSDSLGTETGVNVRMPRLTFQCLVKRESCNSRSNSLQCDSLAGGQFPHHNVSAQIWAVIPFNASPQPGHTPALLGRILTIVARAEL